MRVVLIISAIIFTGCVKYRAKPIDPKALEGTYRERKLPAGKLDTEKLIAAALELHPEIGVARARLQASEAAVISAGAHPNPSISLGGGGTNSPESPVVFHFDPALVIETAHKRELRKMQAVKLAEAARLEFEEARWRVRSRVRAALVERVFTVRTAEALDREGKVRSALVGLLEKRLAAGEIARPVVDQARIEMVNAIVAAKAAHGQAEEGLVALGAALGVTRDAVAKAEIDAAALEALPALESLAKIQEAGLLNRIDVRRMLLQYAASEANLQLEIARQYPDVTLSPGYGFDEGHYKISAGPSLALPVWNRNRGPIAEAEAAREESAARFLVLQAQAIAEMETGLARYKSALDEYGETGARGELADRQERALESALRAGEEDSSAVAGQQVQSAVIARLRLDAWRKAQAALGALEDSVQRPLR